MSETAERDERLREARLYADAARAMGNVREGFGALLALDDEVTRLSALLTERDEQPTAPDAVEVAAIAMQESDLANGVMIGTARMYRRMASAALAAVAPLIAAERYAQVQRVRDLLAEDYRKSGREVSCAGYNVTDDGCFAGSLAQRVSAALDG